MIKTFHINFLKKFNQSMYLLYWRRKIIQNLEMTILIVEENK